MIKLENFGSTHEIEKNSILITPEKRAERENSRSQRRRIQKVFFQLPKTGKPWWKLEPFDSRNRFIQRWNLFMLMPLAVEVWMFPYRLALGVPSISSEMQLILVEFAIDMLFLFDMLISLCTVVPVGPGRDQPLTTFREISRQYFRTTFMCQIMPAFPYWVALFFATNQVQSTCRMPSDPSKISWACVMMDQSDEIHMWWLTSAGRVLPRLWRLVRDFKAMESNLVRNRVILYVQRQRRSAPPEQPLKWYPPAGSHRPRPSNLEVCGKTCARNAAQPLLNPRRRAGHDLPRRALGRSSPQPLPSVSSPSLTSRPSRSGGLPFLLHRRKQRQPGLEHLGT